MSRTRFTYTSSNSAAQVQVGWQVVDVQFQGIGSRLFNLMRILHPSAGRDAVQAANDRDTHRLFDSLHVFQVWLGTDVIVIQVGKVAQRLGKGLGTPVEIVIEFEAIVSNLFLK